MQSCLCLNYNLVLCVIVGMLKVRLYHLELHVTIYLFDLIDLHVMITEDRCYKKFE